MSIDIESKNKLIALLRSYEVNEKNILSDHLKIEKVYNERKDLQDSLESKKNNFKEKLIELRSIKRADALMSGDMARMSLLVGKESKIQKEIEDLEAQLIESSSDLELAKQRVDDSHQELIEIRLEKKRLEKLLENRENFSRSVSDASKEILAEEISYSRRNKGKS